MNAARIGDAGDSALLLQLDAVIDADVNANEVILQALSSLTDDARTRVLGTTAASLFGAK